MFANILLIFVQETLESSYSAMLFHVYSWASLTAIQFLLCFCFVLFCYLLWRPCLPGQPFCSPTSFLQLLESSISLCLTILKCSAQLSLINLGEVAKPVIVLAITLSDVCRECGPHKQAREHGRVLPHTTEPRPILKQELEELQEQKGLCQAYLYGTCISHRH